MSSIAQQLSFTILKVMEASGAEEEKKRKELDALHAKLLKEKTDIMAQLQAQRDGTSNVEDVVNKLEAQKKDLEKQIAVKIQVKLKC